MAYILEKRVVTLKSGGERTEFYYTGRMNDGVTIATKVEELNTIDRENMRNVMKMTGAALDIEVLSKSIKHLGKNVNIVENRKILLESLYFNVYDLVFKWMNQILWDDIKPDLTGAVESGIQLEVAYDKCLKPIVENMSNLINVVIETRFPTGIAEMSTKMAKDRIDLNTKATLDQIKGSKPKTTKTTKTKNS